MVVVVASVAACLEHQNYISKTYITADGLSSQSCSIPSIQTYLLEVGQSLVTVTGPTNSAGNLLHVQATFIRSLLSEDYD